MAVQRRGEAGPTWPGRPADLDPSGRLILGALRYWLLGLSDESGASLSRAWNELARELGPARGREAMSGLIGLVREMRHLRRPLRYHVPCCPCVTGDELALLGFLGSCQKREWALARARAEWLVEAAGIGGLLESGARLAAALAAEDNALAGPDGARARDTGPLAAAGTLR